MKLERIRGTEETMKEKAVKVHPKQVVQMLYVGDNYQGQAIYDLWYWVPT